MAGNISNMGTAQAPAAYSGSHSIDPRYLVTLIVAGDGGSSEEFTTSMDETLAIGLGSQWTAPFENVIQEAMSAAGQKPGVAGRVMNIGGAAMAGMGVKSKYRWQSFQTWQSSDPIHFTIPFTLVALSSAGSDIRDKVVKMLKLVAPTEGGAGGLLNAPGPTMLSQAIGGRDITLRIGQFLELKKCIVTDVQVQFDNTIGVEGIPLRAKVNIDIKSWFTCFTTQDIDALFKMGSGSSMDGYQAGLEASVAAGNDGYVGP